MKSKILKLVLRSSKDLKFEIFALIFVICYLIFATTAVKATGLSLGIYPPIIQVEAIPPVSIKTPITIQNLEEKPVSLKILFKPFTASEKENGELQYFKEDLLASPQGGIFADPLIFQKIQIYDNDHKIEKLTLAPQQEKTLTLHIGITKDDPLSDYYFSIVFISDNNLIDAEKTNLTGVSGGIATNVLLSVGAKDKAKGTIEEYSSPIFLEKGPVPFTVRIKNASTHVIVPKGQILIKNMFGQTVGKVDLLPVNILAGTIRAIPDSFRSPDATPSANFEIRNSKFEITPKANWYESFLLGPYAATLTIALSDQGPLFTKTTHFFAFPIIGIFVLIIALLITILIINRVKSRLYN